MSKQYPVIDADGHLAEPEGALDPYLDPAFRDFAPRLVHVMPGSEDRFLLEGKLLPKPYGRGRGYARMLKWPLQEYQSRSHLEDLDEEGVDIVVLFPSMGLFFSGIESPDVAAAMYGAYNSWTKDYAQMNPARIKPVGVLPLQNVKAAVKEVERIATELEFIGVTVSTHCQGNNLDHPDFEPLLAAVQEAGLPLMIHAGVGSNPPLAGSDRFDNFLFSHQVGHPFEQMISFAAVVAGGVLDRFPRLQVVFCEAGAGWVPYWLERLDEHVEVLGSMVPRLKKKPSEYFADGRIYVTFEPEERTLPYVLETLGEDQFLFASDYPHFDCMFPNAVKHVAERQDLTDGQKRKVLCENAARLFGLEVSK